MSPDTNELSQCGSVDFRWTANSGFSIQYPITVTGVIPNGQVFQWNTTADSTSYTPISIAAGTQVLFSAWDAAGNQAGTSRLQSILESGNGGCLDANSPAYTSVVYPVPTPTVSGSAGASGTSVDVPATSTRRTGVITVTATTIAKGAAGLSGGAIAGIVIGALAGFAILQAIIIWFCCRRHISDMRKQRQQQRMRLATGGVDLYEGSFSSDAEHTMSMNNRRVSLHDIDGAGTIDPFLGGSDPRSSAYTDGDLSLYAPGAHMSGTGTGSPRSSHHPSAPWNDSSAPSSPVTGPSGYASRIPTKLQLAMQNPDNAMFEDEQPRTEAPVGGFRRHEDAGRLGDAPTPEGDVEELPPNYNPAWETDSQK
jgi:hypothetical protein